MYSAIKISEFLHRKKEIVEIDPDAEYALVTVKLHHKGVVLREKKKGRLLGSSMYRISKGQFILSGIDARNGAFGIVPDELDGAIITNDFWCFDVDEKKVKRDFFYWLSNTPLFLDACVKSSKGETQRIRLQKDLFFNFEFHFPPINMQEDFLRGIQKFDFGLSLLRSEQTYQSTHLSLLRQTILQEAIEGKLTAKWREQNSELISGNNHASKLLEKIKAEKERLIKEGRIKKDKPLVPIAESEKPFDLPEGWVWCRLGEICEELSTGPFGSMLHKSDYVRGGIPVVNPMNIVDGEICADERMRISQKTKERLERYSLKQGDLIIARRGNLSKCAVVQELQDGWLCGTGSFFLRVLCVDKRYLRMAYCSAKSQAYLLQDSVGQTMDNLNQKLLCKLPVVLPPIVEQKTIVERVDKLIAMIDELEKQVSERKEQSEMLMQSVLRDAFAKE